jgi:Ca-activated chloride channel family protein
VVRVNAELVILNATVLDKDGRFVSGLRRADFRVFEDGQEQKLTTFTAEETPFAAAILLDTSGSMESRMTLGRSAAIRFLDGLRDEDVAAVYTFDTKIEQWRDFSPGRDLPARVYGLHTRTFTALNDAVLRAADDLAKRPEKRRAIVVLSDGGENYSRASADKALDHAAQSGATICQSLVFHATPPRQRFLRTWLRRAADVMSPHRGDRRCAMRWLQSQKSWAINIRLAIVPAIAHAMVAGVEFRLSFQRQT